MENSKVENKIYNNYHKHTRYSLIDTHIAMEEYFKRAKELGHRNYFTTEHGYAGSIFEAVKLGNKYNINVYFAIEAYIVLDNKLKDRSNYHVMIIAKTDKARKKINALNSDAHEFGYYYKARWSLSDLLKLSTEDVYITSACTLGILKDDKGFKEIFIPLYKHFGKNLLLEVQSHNHQMQIAHNKNILKISKEYNLDIIHANDSHYIYPKQGKDRLGWLKGKGVNYGDEDNFILDYPDYETIIERYKKQGILNSEQIKQSLDSTLLFDNLETIQINKNIKMPNIYTELSPYQRYEKLTDIIKKKWRTESSKIDKSKWKEYRDAIKFEMDIIKETNDKIHTADYFLLNYEVIKKAKNEYEGVLTDTGRGSAVSNFTNKLLDFTGIDRVALNVPIFPTRFLSKSRLLDTMSMPDIDFNLKDPEPFVRATKDLLGEDGCYWMLSYGTMQESEAFRNLCRNENIDYNKFNPIAKDLDSYRNNKYWGKLIKESDKFIGSINNVSRHPCSVLLMNENIREEVGLIRSGDDMVAVITSDESDEWKYLKNDYLTVTVVALIDDTFKLVGIPTPNVKELIELLDYKVWDIYKKGITSTLNQTSTEYSRKLIMKYKPKSYEELSMFVAAIRPGFASLLNGFLNRDEYSSGIDVLDKLLVSSNNYLLYQESIMLFLVWLGIPEDDTYSIIKNIAKKKYMKAEYKKEFYELRERLSKGWIDKVGDLNGFDKAWKVVEDNAFYSFNASHSLSTAIDSLYGAYLKANYPFEYYTVAFNEYENNIVMTSRLSKELEYFNITLNPPQFRYSKEDYTIDKSNNSIYKGMKSIKYMNADVSHKLYNLRDNIYTNFISVLPDIYTTGIDARQLSILIKLNFFKEFGKTKKLLDLVEIYNDLSTAKVLSKENLKSLDKYEDIVVLYSRQTEKQYRDLDNEKIMNDILPLIENKNISIDELLLAQTEYLGYIDIELLDNVPTNYCIVDMFSLKYGTPYLKLKTLKGNSFDAKIERSKFDYKMKVGDILKLTKRIKKNRYLPPTIDKNGKKQFEINKSNPKIMWITEYEVLRI